jgi:NAD(P)-dependent dehydrogenase (short-subunit alcohol dehydrogenase family)
MTTDSQKVALVTDGAQHVGRAIALALAQRGWDVVVHYSHTAEEAAATVCDVEVLGRRAVAIKCDLADESAVKMLLSRAATAIGTGMPVSCLVNNALLFDCDKAAEFSIDQLDRHMRGVAVPVLLAQALHDATPEGSQAVVINLLDQELFNSNSDSLACAISKAALHSATTMLAQTLAPKVRVVGVAPGIRNAPPGRSGTLEDIAGAVCLLAESPGITGTKLLVDGGRHLVAS